MTAPIVTMRIRWDPACSVVLRSNRRRRSTIGTTLPRKIHHTIDEGGRLRQPRDVIWTPRNLADRSDGNTVILTAHAKNDELLVCHEI